MNQQNHQLIAIAVVAAVLVAAAIIMVALSIRENAPLPTATATATSRGKPCKEFIVYGANDVNTAIGMLDEWADHVRKRTRRRNDRPVHVGKQVAGTNPTIVRVCADTNRKKFNRNVQMANRKIMSIKSSGPFVPIVPPAVPVVTKPPSAPRNLEITKQTNSFITLKWQIPANDGGSDILKYIVTQSDDGTTWINAEVLPVEHDQDTRSITVTNVTLGRKYQFRVAAVNSVGQSESAIVDIVVQPPPALPKKKQLSFFPNCTGVYSLSTLTEDGTKIYQRDVTNLAESRTVVVKGDLLTCSDFRKSFGTKTISTTPTTGQVMFNDI